MAQVLESPRFSARISSQLLKLSRREEGPASDPTLFCGAQLAALGLWHVRLCGLLNHGYIRKTIY